MMFRRAAVVLMVLLVTAAALSCSEAKVVEDSASACSNFKDDDGDGLIDCDDPDCFSTAACERNAATCSNGIDDDGNGAIDCQQESCKSLSVCKDAVETACTIAAVDTGCPKGKGCYLSDDNRRFCALEGPSLAGGVCGNTDPSDRSQGCAAGYLCIDRRRCARVCLRDADCTRSSICLSRGGALSVCTLSCVDSRDCDSASEECVPLQRSAGITLERGGWAHQCVPKPAAAAAGSAIEGQPCFEDGRLNRPANELCAADLLCVPEIGGNKCRKVCRASATGGQPSGSICPLGFLCYAVVPFSVQETRVDEPDVVGVCLP